MKFVESTFPFARISSKSDISPTTTSQSTLSDISITHWLPASSVPTSDLLNSSKSLSHTLISSPVSVTTLSSPNNSESLPTKHNNSIDV